MGCELNCIRAPERPFKGYKQFIPGQWIVLHIVRWVFHEDDGEIGVHPFKSILPIICCSDLCLTNKYFVANIVIKAISIHIFYRHIKGVPGKHIHIKKVKISADGRDFNTFLIDNCNGCVDCQVCHSGGCISRPVYGIIPGLKLGQLFIK